ncbi:MAG: alanine--tRNA ligase [Waddliaceae bacterium]
MLTNDIRKKFLHYFEKKGHRLVPSSSVIPYDDPTLLFINAGMNQFKDIFLGRSIPEYDRAATSQKCIRVGGKHNDLENVGHTSRHLTFFEMLGNFSFGSYFKKEAIRFAWEVSTEVFGFAPEKLWPTVFRDDEEAWEIWAAYVPEERITRFEEKHNFWEMGDTGPCGPCSELLYDRGPRYGRANNPKEDVNEERFLEFWNLVFMQSNRDEQGKMSPLPKPSIDTGAGLERIIALKMDVESVYDTDVLRSLIAKVEEVAAIPYRTDDDEKAPAFRVIADHLRCLAFAIADGAQPSNVERGYVLRKVLRRAVKYGRILGMDTPFLADIFPRLIDTMGEDYPELIINKTRIEEILTAEEESFLRTLRRGGNLLNQIIQQAKSRNNTISGEEAFTLKDTYGFPLDEILLLARDAELAVDTRRYQVLEQEAKERSRRVHKASQQIAAENLFTDYQQTFGECEFLGYAQDKAEARVTALVVNDVFVDQMVEGDKGFVILDKTPFYAEKGGQVGDTGILEGKQALVDVADCQSPFTGIIAHLGTVRKGTLKTGEAITAAIDVPRRKNIANNHTATHLLHWALCRVLGPHVAQAGSVVEPARLRFDFTHHKALTQEEIARIEDLVNQKIRENLSVEGYELTFEQAQKQPGIKQFFGEKYGTVVRVIAMGVSKELCGGTHTPLLGNIGLFRIASEGSIAAGIRRIVAVTGEEAEAFVRQDAHLLQAVAAALKTQPDKLVTRIEKMQQQMRDLEQEVKAAKQRELEAVTEDLFHQKEDIQGISLIAAEVSLSPEELRFCAEQTIEKLSSGVVVLGAAIDDRCQVIVRVSDDLINRGIKANDIITIIAPVIEGGGGGKARSAQAGGKAPERMVQAFSLIKNMLTT